MNRWLRIAIRVAAQEVAEAPVPGVHQTEDFTCGPAAMSAALKRFGIEADEMEIAAKAGTPEETGADWDSLAEVARSYGVQAQLQENMSIEDVANCLASDQVVIICIQAYADEGPDHDYSDEWDYGHYVVPTKVEKPESAPLAEGEMTVMDPWLDPDTRAKMTLDDLRERWHVEEGNKKFHTGIILTGQPQPTGEDPEGDAVIEME